MNIHENNPSFFIIQCFLVSVLLMAKNNNGVCIFCGFEIYNSFTLKNYKKKFFSSIFIKIKEKTLHLTAKNVFLLEHFQRL